MKYIENRAISARKARGDEQLSSNETITLLDYINTSLEFELQNTSKVSFRPELLSIAREALAGKHSGMSIETAIKEVIEYAINEDEEDPRVLAAAAQHGIARKIY